MVNTGGAASRSRTKGGKREKLISHVSNVSGRSGGFSSLAKKKKRGTTADRLAICRREEGGGAPAQS